VVKPQRIVEYGPGGVGKSSLAARAPAPRFLDLEGGTAELDVARVELPAGEAEWTHELVRAALQEPELWAEAGTVVIDTLTRAEQLVADWVIANVPKNREGERAERIEDFGYGKGFMHLFDAFRPILADLDRLVAAGKHVVLIAHDCVNNVPNPDGEDWKRWEPRLSDPASGKGSIRLAVREWADHVFCLRYDVTTKDGKGRGHGSRTIYPQERPPFMAKSRSLRDPIPFTHENDNTLWEAMFST